MLSKRWEDNMDVALAEALAIQQAAENDDEEEEDAFNRCQNPLCRNTLRNRYASYCEERTICQQYRSLKLQCLSNVEAAAIRDMESLGRSDSFSVGTSYGMGAKQDAGGNTGTTAGESENAEADVPFVIPRRKRPGTGLAVNNQVRSPELTPPSEMVRPNSRKRPRLGLRMHFNEVLAHFEPVPARAVASQLRARRVQQAARWTRTRKTMRTSGVKPRPVSVTRQAGSSAGVRIRSSLQPRTRMAREFPSRLTEVCNHTSQVASSWPTLPPRPQDFSSMRAKPRSTMREPARESRPATREYFQPRQYNHARWLNPRLPQPSQECHRSGCEYASEVACFPPSRLNGYSGHRSYSERTNVAPELTNIGRGEYVETNRNPNDGNERFRAHRSQYDNEGVGDTVDRNYNTHRACQRKESHRPISTNSTSISFSREVGGAFFNESVPGHAEETIGQSLQQQQNVPTRVSTELPLEVASRPSRVMTPARFTRDSEVADMEQIVSSDTDVKCEPIFSFHDLFLQHLLSMFIQYLPGRLEPMMNFTKKPRKMRWYIKYTTKIEHVCEPYAHLQWESKRVVVMVENRVWLKMKGPSTVTLLQNVIKTMRDHALSWRNFKSEVEQSLELYRRRRGDEVDLSSVFLRAWNNLKDRTGGISLPRGSNYFCGSRLHHWNFIFGKVEIGSGSHEEKRKAFRLAAASAAEFLLGLDDGRNEHRWRPPPRDNNSDTSDDCELLFVRDVNDESVAIAATAAAVTLNDSPEFATDDTSGGEAALAAVISQNGQSGNDAGQVKKSSTSSQVDELAIIVISSDSDTEDEDISEGDGTLAVETPPASSTTGPPSSEPSSEVASTRQCNLCEIIRMRKPDSAGCRQCQLANKPTNINWSTNSNEAVETKVATYDEDAIRAAAGCVGSSETRPSSTNNRPQSTSAALKKLPDLLKGYDACSNYSASPNDPQCSHIYPM